MELTIADDPTLSHESCEIRPSDLLGLRDPCGARSVLDASTLVSKPIQGRVSGEGTSKGVLRLEDLAELEPRVRPEVRVGPVPMPSEHLVHAVGQDSRLLRREAGSL